MKKLILAIALISASAIMAKNLYVRTNLDATSWSNITLGSSDELITLPLGDSIKTFLSVGADSIVYLAPGTYKLPLLGNTLQIKTGKVYGGFSGTESTIDLNARATSDKDGNGIIEPWEFTNEAIITTSNPNFRFTSTGITSGSRMLIVSGTGGELNGVTLTDLNYQGTYSGPIALGVPATTGTSTNNILGKEGILRFCTVKKMKSYIGIVMSTNKFSIIDRCLIESNVVTNGNWGGAIYLNACGGKVTGCMIRNNAASASTGRSAAIHATSLTSTDMDAIVENCVIYNNYVGANGGAIRGEAQGSKRGIEIINTTIVNNQTATTAGTAVASVELISGGCVANSIVVGDPSAEIRANTTNNYIINSAYGEYATGASAMYGSNNVSGKVVADFNFSNPTLFAGAMIPDFTTPWDQAKYDAIRHANFKLTNSASVAATAVSTKTYPASYLIGGTGATVNLSTYSIPSIDMLGVERPISTNGHMDLGAYQFSSLTTNLNNTNNLSIAKNIIAVSEGIQVLNSKGKLANVYNFSGQLVKSELINSDNAILKVNKGLFVVKVGSAIEKVIFK